MRVVLHLLCMLVVLGQGRAAQAYSDLRFSHLDVEEERAQDTVDTLLQDRPTLTGLGADDGVGRSSRVPAQFASSQSVAGNTSRLPRDGMGPQPWWRTYWAYLLYGVAILGALVVVHRARLRNARWRAEAAELRALVTAFEAKALAAEEERKLMERQKASDMEAAHARLEESKRHLKEAQRQLIEAERMASVGALTAGIAHEIKNPLNFVNNFAALSIDLADELAEVVATHEEASVREIREDLQGILEDLKENARRINHHGRRADSIVRSMMEHARGGSGERQPVAVNALVEEYVNLAFHGMRAQNIDFNVTIEREYEEQGTTVEVEPQEIGRVLINLLNNAFYAVEEKWQRLNGAYEPTVAVSTCCQNGIVEIRVRDNGAGMPEEVKRKIFEPFFTTKPMGKGTGLGLSLSYDIVTLGHGGSIAVDTEQGAYTEFLIRLPAQIALP